MRHESTKRSSLAVGTLVAMVSASTLAEESPHSVSANVGLTTDYLFRGISRSNEDPALQGGFEYGYSPLGLYAGAWASSVEFEHQVSDPVSLEIDYSAGLRGRFPVGIAWDLGGVFYSFPDQHKDSAIPSEHAEARGSLGYRFEHVLFAPAVSVLGAWSPDYLGREDDGVYGAGRLDLRLPRAFDLGFTIGHQAVDGPLTGSNIDDYTHWRVGIAHAFLGLNFDASYYDALNAEDCGNDLCDERVVFSISTSKELF